MKKEQKGKGKDSFMSENAMFCHSAILKSMTK